MLCKALPVGLTQSQKSAEPSKSPCEIGKIGKHELLHQDEKGPGLQLVRAKALCGTELTSWREAVGR